ncbi:hypothetical protein LTR17_013570 [Elasticomyces elasticus]|nr:hypothetical protein LTR17_013570 [Elasticomyces elasticus]
MGFTTAAFREKAKAHERKPADAAKADELSQRNFIGNLKMVTQGTSNSLQKWLNKAGDLVPASSPTLNGTLLRNVYNPEGDQELPDLPPQVVMHFLNLLREFTRDRSPPIAFLPETAFSDSEANPPNSINGAQATPATVPGLRTIFCPCLDNTQWELFVIRPLAPRRIELVSSNEGASSGRLERADDSGIMLCYNAAMQVKGGTGYLDGVLTRNDVVTTKETAMELRRWLLCVFKKGELTQADMNALM